MSSGPTDDVDPFGTDLICPVAVAPPNAKFCFGVSCSHGASARIHKIPHTSISPLNQNHSIRYGIWKVFPLKYFDALEPMHEKAGYGGLILHEKAGSGLERVLCGPVRALGRADRSGRGTGLRAAGGRHAHLRRHRVGFPVNSRSRVVW